MQGGCQAESKKYGPDERIVQVPPPPGELKKMKVAKLSDVEFTALMIRMPKELRVQQQHKGRSAGYTK